MAPASRSVLDLLEEVIKLNAMPLDLDEVDKLKQSIRVHPLYRCIHEVLIDHKKNHSISTRMMKDSDNEANDERLDNMLRAEGIVGQDIDVSFTDEIAGSDQNEYRKHLLKVREQFKKDMELYEKNRTSWCRNVESLLQSHREFRPITQPAIEQLVNTVSNKFNRVAQLLKQTTCENVIQLRKRYFDARRKRRNFSKTSTEILNEYFLANINHPYPSEQVKQALAQQCNISVAQVSNWFGNKRIRYKKSMSKNEKERRENETKFGAKPLIPNLYGIIPGTISGIMNPYQMMMSAHQFPVRVHPLNVPVYNQEMVTQYHQSFQNAKDNYQF